MSTMVTTLGFLDTFNATLDRSAREVLHAAPDRVSVSLRGFEPVDGDTVAAVRNLPQVGGLSTGLLVTASASAGSRSVDLVTEVLRPGAAWTPTLTAGTADGGIVLAAKAAADLGVAVGDPITLTHPRAGAAGGLETVRSTLRVAGLHPNPMRMMAYLDPGSAAVLGLDGVTNLLTVTPSAGTDPGALRPALLAVPQVGAAEAGRTTVEGTRAGLAEFLGILRVAAVVTLLLALLTAFNTASIGMGERSREHATMLAFGLPVRTVLGMTTLETLLLGVAGTVVGLAGGYGVLAWMTVTTVPAVMPEIAVTATVAGSTVAAALLLGVGTVAAAPLLTLRRLRRTDIPSALRLVE
jgi:putative ABC transport system permease protein